MNWLDFRSKIINCHVEVAIVVVSFFSYYIYKDWFFIGSLIISAILKPIMYKFHNNFTSLWLNLL